MAVQYPTYQNTLTKGDLGIPDYAEALNKGLSLYQNAYKSKYTPRNLENEAIKAEQYNQERKPYAENANRAFEADIGGQEASAGMNRENILKQKILNSFLEQREPAEISEIKARSKYYEMGGPGSSTGTKNYQAYTSGVAKDNPELNPQQLLEATDVLAKGGNQLKDGTPLNPMSFGTEQAFNMAVKSGTTAAQINSLNTANQAESELDVFTNLANKMRAPYATTLFGKSPEQIVDSFKNDDASQTRLGKLIAANALEFDIAQARNRVGMGQPGITSTNQMIDEAKQHIALYGPRLSAKAREVANNELNAALKQGLSARNRVGAGAGNIYKNQFGSTAESSRSAENSNSNKNKDAFINQVSAQLIKVMPKATPEAIKQTAATRKIPVEQVIQELVKRAQSMQGGR